MKTKVIKGPEVSMYSANSIASIKAQACHTILTHAANQSSVDDDFINLAS